MRLRLKAATPRTGAQFIPPDVADGRAKVCAKAIGVLNVLAVPEDIQHCNLSNVVRVTWNTRQLARKTYCVFAQGRDMRC